MQVHSILISCDSAFFICLHFLDGALDHYSKYKSNIDVHYTSGIYNKA